MRHDTLPTIPPEVAAITTDSPKTRNPLRVALHDQGWSLDIEKKRDELTMLAYRTVFIPQQEKTVAYSLNIDTNKDPVTLLLTRITADVKTSAYDFAVLNPLLMQEFIRGSLWPVSSPAPSEHYLSEPLTNYDLACIAKAVLDRFDNDIVKARLLWTEFWRQCSRDVTSNGFQTAAVFTDTVLKLLPCILLHEELPPHE